MKNSIVQREAYQLTGLIIARGVMAIIFGITALVWPGLTLVSLAVITAIWLLLSGVMGALSSVFMRKNYEHWFLKLVLSLVQLGVGSYLVQRPMVSISTFVLAIGFSFIVEGVVETVLSLTDETKESGGLRVLGMIGGLLTVAGGFLIWRYPVSGSLAFVWVMGLLALVTGTMSVWFGLESRNELNKTDTL
jgi:uncharacterized membrane protein HdeD (DUF308 family)